MVFSCPREWLGWTDIAVAFAAARLRLNDYQIVAFFKLLELFSSDNFSLRDVETLDLDDEQIRYYKKRSVKADALRAFLVHLRVTTRAVSGNVKASSVRPMSWERWVGKKTTIKLKEQAAKPLEFEKALAGREHCLSKEELESLIKEFVIIPEDQLELLISIRVEKWVLDADSRRDYIHKSCIEIERWMKQHSPQTQKLPTEILNKAKKEIRDKLVGSKRQSLLNQENDKSILSLELYWRFDQYSRECGYQSGLVWSDWLTKQIEHEKEQVSRLKNAKIQREIAAVEACRQRSTPILDMITMITLLFSTNMAAINVLEAQIMETIRTVSSHENIELRKGFATLRRTAHSQGDEALISKRDFIRLFNRAMSPLVKLSDKENLFCDRDQATQRAYEIKIALEKRRRSEYRQWAMRKEQDNKKREDQKVITPTASCYLHCITSVGVLS